MKEEMVYIMLRRVVVKQILTGYMQVILVQPQAFGRAPGFWFHFYYVSNGVSSSCLCPLLDGGVCFNGVTSEPSGCQECWGHPALWTSANIHSSVIFIPSGVCCKWSSYPVWCERKRNEMVFKSIFTHYFIAPHTWVCALLGFTRHIIIKLLLKTLKSDKLVKNKASSRAHTPNHKNYPGVHGACAQEMI